MQYPEMQDENIIAKSVKYFWRNQTGLVVSYMTHPITKKQVSLYTIQNIDIENTSTE